MRHLFHSSSKPVTWFSSRIFSSIGSSSRPTIYALSSGYGKCGVAVVRVSGPRASDVFLNMTKMRATPTPRLAKLSKLHDPFTKDILDQGLVIWFPGPNSFTGEDVCELHIHGGQAVITGMLTALSKLSGFQPAEPGEFTRRAFHSGKLDLTEVEGLSDLLSAETEAQRKQAYLQMEGALGSLYQKWRETLLKCVAHLEAFIDFSEDENIEENIMLQVNSKLQELKKDIEDHMLQSKCGERLREGVQTVIIGRPNVGKSSLLNLLCKRPAAIVTPIAGTTRDILEIHMDIGGYPVILKDTAGLHSATHDEVEMEGMNRARSSANLADLLLFVLDAEDCVKEMSSKQVPSIEKYIQKYLNYFEIKEVVNFSVGNDLLSFGKHTKYCIIVLNKTDLVEDHLDLCKSILLSKNVILISCKTGRGIDELYTTITNTLIELCGDPSKERPSFTQARHRHHLSQCLNSLAEYFELAETDSDLVLAAQKLRNALRQLGKITGHVNTEKILDVIFSDFCIGK